MVGNMGQRLYSFSPGRQLCGGGLDEFPPPLGMGVGTTVGEDALGCGSLSGESESAGRGCGTRIPSVGGRVVVGDVGVGTGKGLSERGERPREGDERPSEGVERPSEGGDQPSEGGERSSEGGKRPSEGAERPSEGAERGARGEVGGSCPVVG